MSQGYLKSTGTRTKSLFGFCLSRWLLITGTSAITLKSRSIFFPKKVYLFFWYNTVIYQRVHCVVEMEPYLAQLGIKVNNNDMTVQINVCTCICLDTAHIYLWTSVVSPLLSSSHHQQQTWEMGVWQYHDPSWSLWWTLHSQTHSSPTHWIPDRNLKFILSITDLKMWFLISFTLHKDVENVHVCFMSLLMINVMLSK